MWTDSLQKSLTYTPRVTKYSRKLTADIARDIREEYSVGDVSCRQLGRKYNVNASTIIRIVMGKIW